MRAPRRSWRTSRTCPPRPARSPSSTPAPTPGEAARPARRRPREFWFDEDLSPTLVQVAHERGCEATRDRDLIDASDADIREAAQADDFVLVTDNFSDFRRMYERSDVHPGIVVLPGSVLRSRQLELAAQAIDWIRGRATDAGEAESDWMVNRHVEITPAGECGDRTIP